MRVKRLGYGLALIGLLVGWLAAPLSTGAAEPDYRIPAEMALPWACDTGHEVTWEPEDHWAEGKASGVAYDFSMAEGTPLYAPLTGRAYFLEDERPLETNLGHYVEIVDESGNWLVRLAHLRDAQTGERPVRQGELVGYSGSSGVPVAHLHVELFARQGAEWVAPDLSRLGRLFGLDRQNFVKGALIVHGSCAPRLSLVGPVAPLQEAFRLGQEAVLSIPLRNDSARLVKVITVQALLFSPAGAAVAATVHGEWPIEPLAERTIEVSVRPPLPGDWYVGRVVYQADALSGGMPAKGKVTIAPPTLAIQEAAIVKPVLYVGDRLSLQVRLANVGEEPASFEDFIAEGLRPNGLAWQASAREPFTLAPGQEITLTLRNNEILQEVGVWAVTRLGYRHKGQTFFFAAYEQRFYLFGPELSLEDIEVYPAAGVLSIFLTLRNIGTHPTSPGRLEIWGWKPDGETPFTAAYSLSAPLDPGEATRLRLSAPLNGQTGTWRIVEAGLWQRGFYLRLPLPERLAVRVAATQPGE